MVECKHKLLLDTARALRFQANLPKKFWGECILTAGYIINHLPSATLSNKTPYEVLYNQKPDYYHMRVFGSLTYHTSNEINGDKFEVRGRSEIFLGYPHGIKGYKIFDVKKRKVIVSRDVKFHEESFPFPSNSLQNSEGVNDPFVFDPTHYTQDDDCEREHTEDVEDTPPSPIIAIPQDPDENNSPQVEDEVTSPKI